MLTAMARLLVCALVCAAVGCGGVAVDETAPAEIGAEPAPPEACVDGPGIRCKRPNPAAAPPACAGTVPGLEWSLTASPGELCATFSGVAVCRPCTLEARTDTLQQCTVTSPDGTWSIGYVTATSTAVLDCGECLNPGLLSHWEKGCAL